jgi:predicted dehydrogenase
MSPPLRSLKIGIVGAGAFARFAAQSFVKLDGVVIFAVCDTDAAAAKLFADQCGGQVVSGLDELLAISDVDLVYIATPPALHYTHSKAAILAGKHVICEKPAALSSAEAQEVADLAMQAGLLYVVNLMQRYNPLFSAVRDIIDQNILGQFLHGFFENYASDEFLAPTHWFWNPALSGGIFIEHGVHFFDMFAGWLGQGEMVSSLQWMREADGVTIVDRVQATVAYPLGHVNFYHGFDQPKILDRQEMRLQFETGDITLFEWVPVRIRLHGLIANAQIERLKAMFPGCTVKFGESTGGPLHPARGRFKEIAYDHLVTLEHGDNLQKGNRYESLLTAMLQDQWDWINDRSVQRVIDQRNAIESLELAELAQHCCSSFYSES